MLNDKENVVLSNSALPHQQPLDDKGHNQSYVAPPMSSRSSLAANHNRTSVGASGRRKSVSFATSSICRTFDTSSNSRISDARVPTSKIKAAFHSKTIAAAPAALPVFHPSPIVPDADVEEASMEFTASISQQLPWTLNKTLEPEVQTVLTVASSKESDDQEDASFSIRSLGRASSTLLDEDMELTGSVPKSSPLSAMHKVDSHRLSALYIPQEIPEEMDLHEISMELTGQPLLIAASPSFDEQASEDDAVFEAQEDVTINACDEDMEFTATVQPKAALAAAVEAAPQAEPVQDENHVPAPVARPARRRLSARLSVSSNIGRHSRSNPVHLSNFAAVETLDRFNSSQCPPERSAINDSRASLTDSMFEDDDDMDLDDEPAGEETRRIAAVLDAAVSQALDDSTTIGTSFPAVRNAFIAASKSQSAVVATQAAATDKPKAVIAPEPVASPVIAKDISVSDLQSCYHLMGLPLLDDTYIASRIKRRDSSFHVSEPMDVEEREEQDDEASKHSMIPDHDHLYASVWTAPSVEQSSQNCLHLLESSQQIQENIEFMQGNLIQLWNGKKHRIRTGDQESSYSTTHLLKLLASGAAPQDIQVPAAFSSSVLSLYQDCTLTAKSTWLNWKNRLLNTDVERAQSTLQQISDDLSAFTELRTRLASVQQLDQCLRREDLITHRTSLLNKRAQTHHMHESIAAKRAEMATLNAALQEKQSLLERAERAEHVARQAQLDSLATRQALLVRSAQLAMLISLSGSNVEQLQAESKMLLISLEDGTFQLQCELNDNPTPEQQVVHIQVALKTARVSARKAVAAATASIAAAAKKEQELCLMMLQHHFARLSYPTSIRSGVIAAQQIVQRVRNLHIGFKALPKSFRVTLTPIALKIASISSSAPSTHARLILTHLLNSNRQLVLHLQLDLMRPLSCDATSWTFSSLHVVETEAHAQSAAQSKAIESRLRALLASSQFLHRDNPIAPLAQILATFV